MVNNKFLKPPKPVALELPTIGAHLEKPCVMKERVQRLNLSSIETKSDRSAPITSGKNLHPNHVDLNKVFGDALRI